MKYCILIRLQNNYDYKMCLPIFEVSSTMSVFKSQQIKRVINVPIIIIN